MADPEPNTNVTPLRPADPTNAERQRRHRAKKRSKTTTVGDQGPARAALVHEREAAETALADLKVEKAKVDGERKAVEADLGPVRYLATLLGSTGEQTMRVVHPRGGAAARPG